MTVRVNKSSFNIREKLSELGRKFGLKGSELAAAETVQEARDLVSAGRKNMFINGDCRVAQRSTSMSGRTSGGYWTVDRFQTGISAAGTWTISQSTDVPDGFANSIKYDCTTANTSLGSTAQLYLVQKIEAQNLQHLGYGSSAAQDTTFSFYFKTNKTGVYTVELFQADASRSIGFEMDVSQTGWQRYQFVIPGDTAGTINNDNGIGLWCFVWLAAGSSFTSGTFNNRAWATGTQANRLSPNQVNFADSTSNELYITGYQFELGRNATEFEHRSYSEELQLCKRYYQRWNGNDPDFNTYNSSGNRTGTTSVARATLIAHGPVHDPDDANVSMMLDVEMRDNPTVELPSGNNSIRLIVGQSIYDNATYVQENNCSRNILSIFVDNGGAMTASQPASLVLRDSNSYIALDAEL